jgi:hypothetical protein
MNDRPDWLPPLPAQPPARPRVTARGVLSLCLLAPGVALAMMDAVLVTMSLVDPNFKVVNRTVFPTALV